MKALHALTIAALLALVAAPALAATIEVSDNTPMTANAEYDRNPSLCFDGADYWLFWTKGDDTSTAGVRGGGYNPDTDTYTVWYKSAPTIVGLASATETQLGLSASSRPAGFDQRVVSAVALGTDIYAIVSSGFGPSTDHQMYYYKWNGSSWSGPTLLVSGGNGAHVNATTDGVVIDIVWEKSGGTSEFYTFDPSGPTLTGPVTISTDNMPRINKLGGTLYVASIQDATGDIEIYDSTDGGTTWASHSTAIPGAGLYDPVIFNDGTDLYVVTAPYDGGNDQQWLIQAKYSGGSWSAAKRVSLGGYGGTYWWEYWPMGYYAGGNLYVFFTTETASPTYSDGEIAMFQLDWNLANDHYFYIQNAVDAAGAGDIIEVAAGNYEEQVEITADITLQGAGKALTTIESPVTLTKFFTTGSNDNYPVVFVNTTASATVRDLTVDGLGRGNSNYRFVGIAFWNGGGAALDCDIVNIQDTPFSGAQHGVGIYSYNDTGGPYALEVGGCNVSTYQKTGMALSGDGMTVDVHDCTTTGVGSTTVTAQNGIQVSFGAGGTVSDCSVADVRYTPATWTATGVLLYGDGTTLTTVDLNNVTVTNSQTPVYYIDTSGTATGLDVTGTDFDAVSVLNQSTSLTAPEGRRIAAAPFAEVVDSQSSGFMTLMTVSLTDGCLTGPGAAGAWGLGGYSDGGPTTITVTNMRVTDWDRGLVPYDANVTLTANHNYIVGNTVAGYDNSYIGDPQDAQFNWWGAADGPGGVGPGSGDAVLGSNVDFDPWRTDSGSSTTCGFTPTVNNTVTPTLPVDACVSELGPCVTGVAFAIQRSDNAALRLFDVTFHLSTELQLCSGLASIVEGTYLSNVSGASTTFQKIDNGSGSYTVTGTIQGTPCGATDPTGTLFTIDVEYSGTPPFEGSGTITVDSVILRDCDNPPLFLPGAAGTPATLQINLDAPAAAAGLTSSQKLSGNDADGTTKIDLAWTAPPEPDAVSVEIFRKGWGCYPEYDDVCAAPVAPDDYADAVANWTFVASVPTPATAYTDEPANRDFWYYVAFVKDDCDNVSPVSAFADDTHRGTAGTLNYHLGDVAGGPDNDVAALDISALGAVYGFTPADGGWDPEIDVGPTSNWSTYGLPLTDDVINFEDLLMFAINFGVVSMTEPPVDPDDLPDASPRLDLVVEPVDGNQLRARLLLSGNPGIVKGVHAVIALRGAELLSVEQGELLASQGEEIFFTHLPEGHGVGIHTAILGRDVGLNGDGEVATLLLRGRAGATAELRLADIRDLANRHLGDAATTAVGNSGGDALGAPLPTRFELLGAQPNPFNPSTTIRFRLPVATQVRLQIYDVGGRLVRSLANQVFPAGEHGVVWDGRDARGQLRGSGVYLYAIQAGEIDTVEKLVLVK